MLVWIRSGLLSPQPHQGNLFCSNLYRFGCQALSLLGWLFHGLAQWFCILHHSLELRVSQHPEQVIQKEHQLRGYDVAIFGLKGPHRTQVKHLVSFQLLKVTITPSVSEMAIQSSVHESTLESQFPKTTKAGTDNCQVLLSVSLYMGKNCGCQN